MPCSLPAGRLCYTWPSLKGIGDVGRVYDGGVVFSDEFMALDL